MDFEKVELLVIESHGQGVGDAVYVRASDYNTLLSAHLELKETSDRYLEALVRLRDLYGGPGE